jgi:hypothetical protein
MGTQKIQGDSIPVAVLIKMVLQAELLNRQDPSKGKETLAYTPATPPSGCTSRTLKGIDCCCSNVDTYLEGLLIRLFRTFDDV